MNTWLRVAFCFLVSFHAVCLAQQVFVRAPGEREGRGIARSRYHDCFVIAPWHITKGRPGSVVILGEKGIQAEAQIAYDLQNDDITILKLTSTNSQICSGSAWPRTTDLGPLLSQGGETFIKSRNPDGSLSQIQVTVEDVDDTFLTLLPGLGSKPIAEGLSGSSVILNGRLVGLLLSANNGRGKAVRLDFLDAIWQRKLVAPGDACLQGCSLPLSQLQVAGKYARGCQAYIGTSIQCQETEYVFHFPDDWPIAPFLHVAIQTTRIEAGDLPPVVGHSVSKVDLSESLEAQASSEYVDVYDALGKASTVYRRNKRVWDFTLSGLGDVQHMSVHVKPYR